MIEHAAAWAEGHQALLAWLAGLSLLVCIASIIALPFLAALIPEDYFVSSARHESALERLHPAAYIALRIAKNMVGWTLIVAGTLMLVLPGQGILTILMGLVLSDFPGKYKLEQRLAGNARIMSGINWLRQRNRRPPLRCPGAHENTPSP